MIIQDLFLYFARFPKKTGVKAMATMGSSEMPEYATLMDALDALPTESLVPDIDHYVYGQSIDDLKIRLDKLIGTWLYADYGEITSMDDKGSMEVTLRIAVTVAMRLRSNADMLERMIASDRTLGFLSQVQARIMADADNGLLDWLSRDSLRKTETIPFVASELGSYGWTLLIDASAPDTLGTNGLARSYRNRITLNNE